MVRLIVNGQSLDLPPNLRIPIKRSNPAYMGVDVNVIKSTYSNTFSLPLTPTNNRALNFPSRLDGAEVPAQVLPAQLYVGPERLLSGTLTVRRPSRTEVKVYLVANPLADLTKIKLNETEQGVVAADGAADLADLMKDTTNNPLSYDYCFAPVYNFALRETADLIPAESEFMNAWHFDDQRFTLGRHVSPLLRVKPMLAKAMAHAGYTINDGLHVSAEMKRQVLVSNRSMFYDGDLSTRLPLNMCLPDTTIAEFLKSLCRTYCLAPFSDLTGNHIDLIPLRSLVRAAPRRDWTNYASRDYTREPGNGAVSRYTWGEAAYAKSYAFSDWSSEHPEPDFTRRDFLDDNGDEVPVPLSQLAYYNSRSAVSIRKKIRGLFGFTFLGSFGYHTNRRPGEVVSPSIPALQTNLLYAFPSNNDQATMACMAATPVGISTEPVVVPEAFGAITSEEGDVSVGLSFYRGLQFTRRGQQYPMLSHNPYDTRFGKIEGERYSLNWLGEDGLYNRWWKEWDGMLSESAGAERTFRLPLTEVLGFDFRDKVRVENRNYFVRELEFSVGADGVSATKCSLVSVS